MVEEVNITKVTGKKSSTLKSNKSRAPLKKVEPKKKSVPTKAIKNECLQSLEVYFMNEDGQDDTYWLRPKEMIQLPASCLTSQIDLLEKRRLIRVYNI